MLTGRTELLRYTRGTPVALTGRENVELPGVAQQSQQLSHHVAINGGAGADRALVERLQHQSLDRLVEQT